MSTSLVKTLENISSQGELSEFVNLLLADFRKNKDDWENQDLPSFLNALSAWIESMDGYYANQGKKLPENIPWKILGDILYAAKLYE